MLIYITGRSSDAANPNHLYKYSAESLSRDAGKLDEEIGLECLPLFQMELLCSGGINLVTPVGQSGPDLSGTGPSLQPDRRFSLPPEAMYLSKGE